MKCRLDCYLILILSFLISCQPEKESNSMKGEWFLFYNVEDYNSFLKDSSANNEIIEIYDESLEWKGGLFFHDRSKFQGQFANYKILDDFITFTNNYGLLSTYKITISGNEFFKLEGEGFDLYFYKKGNLSNNLLNNIERFYCKKTIYTDEHQTEKEFIELHLKNNREVCFNVNISTELNGYYTGILPQDYYDYLLNQFGKVDFNQILKSEKASFSHLDSIYIEIQFRNETITFCPEELNNPTNDFRDAIQALNNVYLLNLYSKVDSMEYAELTQSK
ncbi:hypothetical protein [Chondrinema litorale]|uniref:hypothetical protein n=1 Tax=Chondrinema litorale TaxID=2994555 RepID=UPI0025433832|nr:hypothetical protein [Chondrinema litorale]UZR99051.1 hypothetical protein OQ292_34830 [Chondrinema litorale]